MDKLEDIGFTLSVESHQITEIPQAPLRYFNDVGGGGGGTTEVHIIYPPKFQLQNLFTPKNPYLAYQKNPTQALNCAYAIVDLS